MATARRYHTATLLASLSGSGIIVVAGGNNPKAGPKGVALTSVEALGA